MFMVAYWSGSIDGATVWGADPPPSPTLGRRARYRMSSNLSPFQHFGSNHSSNDHRHKRRDIKTRDYLPDNFILY